MLPQKKEIKADYNDSSYYRANPYSQQGYIPTQSLKNRKIPDHPTQIPQGVEYFDHSHRKLFISQSIKSQMVQQRIFSNPEKFPLENSLALDKAYNRSLNTIDIERANANSKMSEALRNKIKAQQQLERRKHKGAEGIVKIRLQRETEDQLRRKLAKEQMQKLKNRQKEAQKEANNKQYSSMKILPRYYETKPKGVVQFGVQAEDILGQKLAEKNTDLKVDEQLDKLVYLGAGSYPSSQSYELLTKKKKPQMAEDAKKIMDFKFRNQEIQGYSSQSQEFPVYTPNTEDLKIKRNVGPSELEGRMNEIFSNERKNIQADLKMHQLREQYKKINPISLSYEGNMVRKSNIFGNLGKNIAHIQ